MKQYSYTNEQLVTLLLEYKKFMSIKFKEYSLEGNFIQDITQSDTKYWTEEFIDRYK